MNEYPIDWKDISSSIWSNFDNKYEYKWSIKKHQRNELFNLITQNEFDQIFYTNEDIEINRRLRPIMSSYLGGRDREKATRAALWIVSTWGGINKGKEKLPIWSTELDDFNENNVKNFIRINDTRKDSSRISSWSKLLAFYNEKNYAIYDARTSISLNCALALNEKPFRFYTPKGRNTSEFIISATGIFRKSNSGKKKNQNLLGYTDYLDLLFSLVSSGKEKNIFEAEMKLFSQTERLAKSYLGLLLNKHN